MKTDSLGRLVQIFDAAKASVISGMEAIQVKLAEAIAIQKVRRRRFDPITLMGESEGVVQHRRTARGRSNGFKAVPIRRAMDAATYKAVQRARACAVIGYLKRLFGREQPIAEKTEAWWNEVDDPIHHRFNLTYASYLTIPRSVLQSMPTPWQRKMVALLSEMAVTCDEAGVSLADNTNVFIRDSKGRFVLDPLADYDRGRRNVFAEGKE